jgi:hypothetical protein
MSELQNPDLSHRLVLAAAEDTPSEVLQQLATDSEKAVRQAVAGNPNTPIDTLLKLGAEFRDEITTNPIFSIQLLAEPESHFVRLSLARSSTTSEKVLAKLSKIPDEDILCAIAQNPATSATILESLVRNTPRLDDWDDSDGSEYDRLFSFIAKNPKTPSELLLHLASLHLNIEITLAENPNTPLPLLEKFAGWRNIQMHKALARNPGLPSALLEILAGEDNRELRYAIKAHPHVSPTAIDICNFVEGKPEVPVYILEKLAGDRREQVRRLVAQHPQTPISIIIQLIQDPEPKNRVLLVTRLDLPADALAELTQQLVKDYSESFRRHPSSAYYDYESAFFEIIEHPNLTAKSLEYLARLGDFIHYETERLVELVAANKEASAETLIQLARIRIHRVIGGNSHLRETVESLLNSDALRHIPDTPAAAIETIILLFLENNLINLVEGASQYISNPHVPIYLLEKLASRKDTKILVGVASNPITPINILQKLAIDAPTGIRSYVAKNPSTPPDLLEILSNDVDSYVRCRLIKNPNLSVSCLNKLVLDPDEDVRASILERSDLPTQIVERLANDISASVRAKVAIFPNISIEIIMKLLNESELEVLFQLAERKDLSDELSSQLKSKLNDF